MNNTKNKISLIVAMSQDYAIGKNNQLLWKISDDLKCFKQTTIGHVVIHGRKSYESIGNPLPNRTNIVISRQENFIAEGCLVVNSVENAISLANTLEQNGEIFILGGAQIYEIALPLVDNMYISKVEAEYPDADTFFPPIDWDQWTLESTTAFAQSDKNEHAFSFNLYQRK